MITVYEEVLSVERTATALKEFLKEQYGITRRRLTLLLAIADSATPLTIGGCVKALGIANASMTNLVDRLESSGYIERQRSTTDRRAIALVLTAKGQELVARIKADPFVTDKVA